MRKGTDLGGAGSGNTWLEMEGAFDGKRERWACKGAGGGGTTIDGGLRSRFAGEAVRVGPFRGRNGGTGVL